MSLPTMLRMPNDTRKLPPPFRISLQSALEDEKRGAKKLPNTYRLIFALKGIQSQAPQISSHRLSPDRRDRTIAKTADSRSGQDPVLIPRNCLLREYVSVPPAICLEAAADVLLMLHVHVVELVDWDRIGRTRSAGREGARWALW